MSDVLTIQVTDSLGLTAQGLFTIPVNAGGGGTLIVTANGGLPVPPGAVGVPYELILNCTNGTGALTWAVTSGPSYGSVSNAVSGLSATQALFSGTPNAITSGDTFVITATDSLLNTGSITFTI